MGELICKCDCGNTKKLSEYALGMTLQCPKCGARFTVDETNTHPVEGGEPAPKKTSSTQLSAISSADQKPLQGPQRCARCNREFRGDWDRYHSPVGMVCHVCANLATGHEPQQPAPQHNPVKAPDVPAPILDIEEPAAPPREGKGTLLEQFDEFKETPTFRAIVWGLAIVGMGAAVVVYVFAGGFSAPEKPPRRTTVMEEQAGQTQEQPERRGLGLFGAPEKLTKGQGIFIIIMVRGLQLIFIFIPNFAALFWTLWKAGRLPCYHWWANAIHVGVAAAIMSVAIGAISMVAAFLPIGAWLYAGVAYCVLFYIIYEVYDLFLRDLLVLAIVRLLFFFLFVPVQYFVYGGLGLLLLE